MYLPNHQGKRSKCVLKYKEYKVFKTPQKKLEVWDYTFQTPTTWICGIVKSIKDAKPFIDKCISNNKRLSNLIN